MARSGFSPAFPSGIIRGRPSSVRTVSPVPSAVRR